jgi:hypothetical protein
MKRAIKLTLGVATLGALVMPMGAQAARGTSFGTFRLHSDGSHTSLGVLPPGIYDITAIGTADYDMNTTPHLLADAGCTTGSDSTTSTDTVYRDVVDTLMHDTVGNGLISTWHRRRYDINGDTLLLQTGDPLEPTSLFYTGDPLDDAASIYIKGDLVDTLVMDTIQNYRKGTGHAQVWIPTFPSLTDPADDSLVLGCNLGTHQYDTIVVSDGSTPIELTFFDTNYDDNVDMKNSDAGPAGAECASSSDPDPACGFVIQVGQLLG